MTDLELAQLEHSLSTCNLSQEHKAFLQGLLDAHVEVPDDGTVDEPEGPIEPERLMDMVQVLPEDQKAALRAALAEMYPELR